MPTRRSHALLLQWNEIAAFLESRYREERKKKRKKSDLNLFAESALLFREVLDGWKQERPGHERLAAFFVTQKGERVIVEELLEPSGRKEAEQSRYRLVPFGSTWSVVCRMCGTQTKVIEGVVRERGVMHRFFSAPCFTCLHIQGVDAPKGIKAI